MCRTSGPERLKKLHWLLILVKLSSEKDHSFVRGDSSARPPIHRVVLNFLWVAQESLVVYGVWCEEKLVGRYAVTVEVKSI